MKRTALTLIQAASAAFLLCAVTPAMADAAEDADRAGFLDCLTTADALDALAGSAREANPIGAIPACVMKPLITRYYDKLPEPDRTQGLTTNRAVWDGAAANNVAVLLHLSSAASLGIGAIVGFAVWQATAEEREFAQLCAMHRVLAQDQTLRCVYAPAHRSQTTRSSTP